MTGPHCSVCGEPDAVIAGAKGRDLYCIRCQPPSTAKEPPPERSLGSEGGLGFSEVVSWDFSVEGSQDDAGPAIDKTARRAAALGIPGPKEGAGPCVLPGHSHPAHLAHDNFFWKYWCAACDRYFSLAEVRAILAYEGVPGDPARQRNDPEWRDIWLPGPVEVSRWAERLDFEAGLLEPRHVDLVLPQDLSASATAVAKEVGLLLGLRTEMWRENRGEFTLARRMTQALTGLSDAKVRAALKELRIRRVLWTIPLGTKPGQVKKAGRALVYRLGTPLEIVDEEGVFELLKQAFDAEEISDADTPS